MISIEDIENHKHISNEELDADLARVKNYNPIKNKNNSFGNKFLYHFQLKNILKCRRYNKPSIYEIFANPIKLEKFSQEVAKRNRGNSNLSNNYFECYRVNHGSIVMFKTTTAMYLYNKYDAKQVLDPTAGWGGRMLGAWALDIDYTGIDTNIEMKPAYDSMINYLSNNTNEFGNGLFVENTSSNLQMIWSNCLSVDFSKIDYDFVLTSPPYINLERYEHMELWDNDTAFYKEFFVPLWQKCVDNIKHGGHVCFNISPKMYDDAVANGLPVCDMEEDLLQQLRHQKNKKQDKIYIWKKE